MNERVRSGRGMARPELCILLAYAKRSLEEAIRGSSLPDEPFLDADVERYFPPKVSERFGGLIARHPLRRDLAATILANAVCNDQGITFVSRLAGETGAEPAEIVRAYRIAREVTDATARWDDVEALDGKIDPTLQNVLMVGVDTLVEDVSRWYVVNAPSAPLEETIEETTPLVGELAAVLDRSGSESWRAAREVVAAELVREGVEERLARRHAFQPELAHAPDIIAVARGTGRSLEDVASAFFLAGERLHLDWLEGRLVELPEASSWQRWAARAIESDVMALRREIAQAALSHTSKPAAAALDDYLAARTEAFERLRRLIDALAGQGETSLAALTVAVRQVRGLAM
jgi:glutamate dehydrogenase